VNARNHQSMKAQVATPALNEDIYCPGLIFDRIEDLHTLQCIEVQQTPLRNALIHGLDLYHFLRPLASWAKCRFRAQTWESENKELWRRRYCGHIEFSVSQGRRNDRNQVPIHYPWRFPDFLPPGLKSAVQIKRGMFINDSAFT
jgi:hypothetical protein